MCSSLIGYCLTVCPRNKYKCNMGLCVPVSTWCDGYLDCPDGSDEFRGCNASKFSRYFVQSTFKQEHNVKMIISANVIMAVVIHSMILCALY